jgi:hypothetical protein
MDLFNFYIQKTKEDIPPFIRYLSRVNYEHVSKSLKYPIAWIFDYRIKNWLPYEVTNDLAYALENKLGLSKEQVDYLETTSAVSKSYDILALREQYLKYEVVELKNLIPKKYVEQLIAHFWEYKGGHIRQPDMPGISRVHVGNLPLGRLLHESTVSLINSIVPAEEKIKTSYSIMSNYDNGSILPKHVDRIQCPFNISLMLDSTGVGDWPLYVETSEILSFNLLPGDGVLYKGTKHEHWRDKMPSTLNTVLGSFMHYVPIDFQGSLD